MSLLDLIAAAGEEFMGLRVLGSGQRRKEATALAQRIERRFLKAALVSLLLLAVCWVGARALPASRAASLAAVGMYVAVAAALFSALGWAYARAALGKAAA